ncbi:MAG: ATP-binding protein [Gammaproteobacteria bacterium]|jgi:AAA+ ATPase superfamily predicted ATPase
MDNVKFVGRKTERELLNQLLSKKTSSLVVITGRRRVGKSRLIEEFVKKHKCFTFVGLAPQKETTAQSQRDEFALQLSQQTGLPEIKADDWSKLFLLLTEKVNKERVIIVFDEVSWLGSKDHDFLGKLKNAWDTFFKKNSKLIFILCGSVSSWIEKNILSGSEFFGRVSLKITLEELPVNSAVKMLNYIGFRRSSYEKFMLLSVLGGIPWYIELINPILSAENNIKQLCFFKDGILTDEFKKIFHDLFGKRGEICRRIVEYLSNGPAEYKEIVSVLNYYSGGSLSDYLNDLVISGFIKRDYTWAINSGKDTSLSKYRLCDNYLRFYLKYISPKINQIKKGQYADLSINSLPGWSSIIGFQFENLVLNNRKLIWNILKLKPEDILNDNPFFQHKTLKQKGCQIDYLIQTKHKTLFACEIKFYKNEIGLKVVEDVKQKLSKINVAKGFVILPVLIYVGGVTQEVKDSDYFYSIIDFCELLSLDLW